MSVHRDKTERLLNLLIALKSSRDFLDRDRIRAVIDGYAGLDDAAFDRQFSRDKDELRRIGVSISTLQWDDFHSGANATISGYRVDEDSYELPPVHFTPDEAAVVAAAARLWHNAALGKEAARAVTKLAALGVQAGQGPDFGSALSPEKREPAFRAVYDALSHHRAISFNYRKPGRAEERRRIEPWGLLTRDSRSYVGGLDLDKNAPRVFRIARITNQPSPVPGRAPGDYTVPDDFNVRDLLRDASRGDGHESARVRLRPGRGGSLRRSGRVSDANTPDVVEVQYRDVDEFVGMLAEFGPDVLVESPPEVRHAHLEHLVRTARRLEKIAKGGERG